MKTSAKNKLKRFEAFYLKGELQPHFIQSIKTRYEDNVLFGEAGVVKSWFDHCEVKHGNIPQPHLGGN